MEKTREIKNILLGHFAENENGKLQMIPKGTFVLKLRGAYPGWQATFFFGVGSSRHIYEVSKKNRNKAWISLEEILQQMGDSLELTETQNVHAYLCNYRLSIPAVLVAEETKEGFCFTVFTGRSPTSWISRYRTLQKIKNLLPEFFVWNELPKENKFKQKADNVKEHWSKKKKEIKKKEKNKKNQST